MSVVNPGPGSGRAHDRRTVVRAGAVGLTLAGLAGCGPDGPDASTAADGSVEVPVSEVPLGGSAYLASERLVLTHPREGEFHAFEAACPHEGCLVRGVEREVLLCPCHGSEFDPATGQRLAGPAPDGLPERVVEVAGDTLRVSGG